MSSYSSNSDTRLATRFGDTDLSRLIALVETARGPDRELDAIISWELGWRNNERYLDGGATEYAFLLQHSHLPAKAHIADRMGLPTLTASLDAALALVERVMPGWEIFLSRLASDNHWEAEVSPAKCPGDELYRYVDHRGATPALALLKALLHAVQAQSSTEGTHDGSSLKTPHPITAKGLS